MRTTGQRVGHGRGKNSQAKLGIVVEEADEAIYWLEMLIDAGIVGEKRLKELLAEAHELTAIFTAAQHTSRRR